MAVQIILDRTEQKPEALGVTSSRESFVLLNGAVPMLAPLQRFNRTKILEEFYKSVEEGREILL